MLTLILTMVIASSNPGFNRAAATGVVDPISTISVSSEQYQNPVVIDTGLVPDKTFAVVVRTAEVPALSWYGFTLSFNGTILQEQSVGFDGTIFGCEELGRCSIQMGTTKDIIEVASVQNIIPGAGNQADGSLASIIFEVQTYGSTRLTLGNVKLVSRETSSPIPYTATDGYLSNTAGLHIIPYRGISIVSDRDFTSENGVIAGSGTLDNPYIIEGWDILGRDAKLIPIPFNTYLTSGILIANTTAHLIIRHVQVHEGGRGLMGILLWNTTNAEVESSRVWSGNTGVWLAAARNSKVTFGEFHNLLNGIVVSGSLEKTITSTGNTIYGNQVHDSETGIQFLNATGNIVSRNTISRAVWALQIEWSSSDNLFSENHVLDSIVGVQVFAESNRNIVSNNRVEITTAFKPITGLNPLAGVAVGRNVQANVVVYNDIRGFERGVILGDAFDTVVSSNNVQATSLGVQVKLSSSGNRITGNAITAPVGILLCSKGPNFIAPPPNNLTSTDKRLDHCQGPFAG